MFRLRLQIDFHFAEHQRMTQRDQLPGAFGRLDPGDTRGGKHIAFVVAAVDNHRQGRRLHFDISLGARFAHRFRFAGDIDHMGFTRGVNMGQL